jgi:molybdenum cofactor cytidylyltransferase
MARAPSFCGVILAAGESLRMGRDKALLPWPPQPPGATASTDTFLTAAIDALDDHSDLVIVVAGKNANNLAPLVYANSAFLAVNPAPERGQFSSLQVGLQDVLNRGRDAAIITLVDRPPARSATLDHLHRIFEDVYAREKWAVIPEFEGKHGHPILIGREMIHAFLTAPPTAVARDIEHEHQGRIEYVPVDDPFVSMNVDTPADYESLLQRAQARK